MAKLIYSMLTSCVVVGVVLILPFVPAAVVLGVGYLVPGKIAWSVANNAVLLGSILGVVGSAFFFFRFSGPRSLRLIGWILVAIGMLGFSRGTFFTSQECVTQQGKFIDIQRQVREIRAAEGASCG